MRFLLPFVASTAPAFAQPAPAPAAPAPAPKTISLLASAGIGASNFDVYNEPYGTDYSAGLSVFGLAARELTPGFSLGLRAAYVRVEGRTTDILCYQPRFTYHAIDVGLTALMTWNRFWIAPWVGVDHIGGEHDELRATIDDKTTLAYGANLGVTVVRFDRHRIDLAAGAMQSMKDSGAYGQSFFRSLTLGVAYRY